MTIDLNVQKGLLVLQISELITPPLERQMKHLLLTTIAAVLVVGCGNSEADRALFDAAKEGNIEAVKQALNDGADVDSKDEAGETSLNVTARKGHTGIAELLIAKGADVNAKEKMLDEAPLHLAARYGHSETVELLLAKGADVNAKL